MVVPSAEVLVFYGPSQRPTGRDAIVNYNSASGSAAGVVSAEVAVGAGAIPNVSLLETKGGLESVSLGRLINIFLKSLKVLDLQF